MVKKYKSEKAITLVSLVITIVVMLILAGVSISFVIGQNGLFTKSQSSVNMSKQKAAEEKVSLILGEYQVDQADNNENLEDFLNEKKTAKEIDDVINNGDGTFTVTVDGYKITIKEEDLSITKVVESGSQEKLPSDLQVGSFVQYGVSYMDMYRGYEFTENDGWRVLNKGYKNSDGTYSGVQLISTGVPLKYMMNSANSISSNTWTASETQCNQFLSKFNITALNTDFNVQTAATLYYNFDKIPCTYMSDYTYGGISDNSMAYSKINNVVSSNLMGSNFLVNGAKEAHALTLYELNEVRSQKGDFASDSREQLSTANDGAKGLFYLPDLNSNFKYSTSACAYYWVPSIPSDDTKSMYIVSDSSIAAGDNLKRAVRVVVTLPDNATVNVTRETLE